tara:strand:+ start:144 stop:926 length:783 start_codon:yes stop_codon:yes gene_type:complete
MNNDNTLEVGKVFETYNYDLFIKVKGNRAINQAHVNRLANKMEHRFLKELPIIVGPKNNKGKYPILDGQHSRDSRETKGLPIRYIIAEHIRPDDISSMNTDKLNWSDKDYLNKYVEKNNENYVFYRDIMNEYPGLRAKFSVWTTILNGSWKRNTELEKQFKNGLFSITEADKKEAHKVASYLTEIMAEIPNCRIAMFYFPLLHAMGHHGFDRTHFLHKVRKQSKKFKGASNSQEWLEIIDYVYNKYNKKKSRKHLDFDQM